MKKKTYYIITLFIAIVLIFSCFSQIKTVFPNNNFSEKTVNDNSDDAINECYEISTNEVSEDKTNSVVTATRGDLLKFILDYHEHTNNAIKIDEGTTDTMKFYSEYFSNKLALTNQVSFNFFGNLDISINKNQFVEVLQQIMPYLEFELKSNETMLATYNVQDASGQYALKLCNAGIFQESDIAYDWYRVLSKEDFDKIVERFYHLEKREVKILKGLDIKKLSILPDKYKIKSISGNYAITENEVGHGIKMGLFDIDKDKEIFSETGNSLRPLGENMFVFDDSTYTSIINGDGEVVYRNESAHVSNYAQGFCAFAGKHDRKVRLINKNGEETKVINGFSNKDYEMITNTGEYLGINYLSDDNSRFYNYKNKKWTKTPYDLLVYGENDKITAINFKKDEVDILNADLSVINKKNGRYLLQLSNNYYALNIDSDSCSIIKILDKDGVEVTSHEAIDFDKIYFNPLGDYVAIVDRYNIMSDYPNQYTIIEINKNKITKYSIDMIYDLYFRPNFQPDIKGRRLFPEGYVLAESNDYISKRWFYEYKGNYYIIKNK